ncbi:MAG: hypothetical protein ABSH27_01045 [Solirubrobacteraceae bacterium]
MRRGLAGAIMLISLLLAAPAPALAGALTRVSPPGGAYSVELPIGWHFKNESYPSDHATHLWSDPADARRKLEVVLSGCVGCASRGTQPNPIGGLPAGVLSKLSLSRWEVAFTARGGGDPYPDNGIVIVMHRGSQVEGYVQVQLWLPASQHAAATTILNSFRLGA